MRPDLTHGKGTDGPAALGINRRFFLLPAGLLLCLLATDREHLHPLADAEGLVGLSLCLTIRAGVTFPQPLYLSSHTLPEAHFTGRKRTEDSLDHTGNTWPSEDLNPEPPGLTKHHCLPRNEPQPGPPGDSTLIPRGTA